MSLCASSVQTVYVLLHLCQKYPDAGLGQYVYPVIRQMHEDMSYITAKRLSENMRFLLPLEIAFEIKGIGPITAGAKASGSEHLEMQSKGSDLPSSKGRAKIAIPSPSLHSPSTTTPGPTSRSVKNRQITLLIERRFSCLTLQTLLLATP